MALNFNLLNSDEIKIIQDISCATLNLYGDKNFSFKDLREKINVIISEKKERVEISTMLKKEQEKLTKELEKERKKRDKEQRMMPPYENPSNTHEEDIENLDELLTSIDNCKDWSMETHDSHNRDLQEGKKTKESSRLNDAEITQIKDRIKQIDNDIKRLGSVYILGYYIDDNSLKKVTKKSKNIYIFIDNIKSSIEPVNQINEIACTFTYLMFIAYHCEIKTYPFISSNKYGIRELDIAMAKFGMLKFIEEYDNKNSTTISSYASARIRAILRDDISYFRTYGMGYILFNKFNANSCRGLKDNYFSIYRKIWAALNKDIIDVSHYCNNINSTSPSYYRCLCNICQILIDFDKKIETEKHHFNFNGTTNIQQPVELVRLVIKNYIDTKTPTTFNEMVLDFDNNNKAPIFEKEDNIGMKDNKKYESDSVGTLTDGSVIYLSTKWNTTIKGKTHKFIDKVNDDLYTKGFVSAKIEIVK